MNDVNSLFHASGNHKYHIVFLPPNTEEKYFMGKTTRDRTNTAGIVQLEKNKNTGGGVCLDHIHMPVEIPPKIALSSFRGFLKGKSTVMLYEKFPGLKYKYRNREFWREAAALTQRVKMQ